MAVLALSQAVQGLVLRVSCNTPLGLPTALGETYPLASLSAMLEIIRTFCFFSLTARYTAQRLCGFVALGFSPCMLEYTLSNVNRNPFTPKTEIFQYLLRRPPLSHIYAKWIMMGCVCGRGHEAVGKFPGPLVPGSRLVAITILNKECSPVG